jgi:peptide/nickel transport system permease protein
VSPAPNEAAAGTANLDSALGPPEQWSVESTSRWRGLLPVGRQLAHALPLAVLVFAVAIVINFALPRLAPGNPIDFLIPPDQAAAVTPAQRTHLAALYGLNGSEWQQFQHYVGRLAHGDLGISTRYGQPVTTLLAQRLPWTLLLLGTALVLSTLIGSGLGFRSAWRRGTPSDIRTLTGVMLADSFPPFFTSLLLVLLFSVTLKLLPVFGALPTGQYHGAALAAEVARRAILPITALTLGGLGSAYLIARSAAVSEIGEDYVTMAAAKGLDAKGVRRHARRNALVPVWTVGMLNVGALFGGAAPVETVFAYPGLGRLIYDSVLARDYAVLQGAFLLIAAGVIVANLIGELAYPFLDPRVRRPAIVTT